MQHFPIGTSPLGSPLKIEWKIEKRSATKGVMLVFKRDGEEYEYIPMRWCAEEGDCDVYCTQLDLEVGLYYYHFVADGMDYGADYGLGVVQGGEDWHLTVYEERYSAPAFLQGGLFYQIMVDRFAMQEPRCMVSDTVARTDWGGVPTYKPDERGIVKNNDFFGGNLRGITQKLDYLQGLGVTCLYLNPIFEAKSNHKYDTANYLNIDPGYGTEQDLRDLVSAAKARGIAVVLDGVFSHTGEDSVYFNRYGHYDSVGAYQSKDSPYYSWYDFKHYPDEYACWWGIRLLPNVNETEPSYLDFVTGKDGVIAHWMKTGIAGWRLDVADELPDAFIARLTAAAKAEKPDALVLGEVWEDASDKVSYSVRRKYFQGAELDSVTNYVFRTAILDYLTDSNAGRLAATVHRIVTYYPKKVLHALMNVIGTHDTPRMLNMLSGVDGAGMSKDARANYVLSEKERQTALKKLRLAAVLQYTLPGVPCLYYGDEAGMEGYEDPFNRRCYPWGSEDKELLAFYRRLGAIRQEQACFADGAYRTVESADGVFAFTRSGGGATVLVGINPTLSAYSLETENTMVDLMTGATVTKVQIPPQDFVILGVQK